MKDSDRVRKTRLGIVGLGLANAVGTNAITSCAAVRAGIVRPQPLPGWEGVDPDSGAPEPLVGHPVSFLTKGFAGAARLARLGALALEDLVSRAQRGPADLAGIPTLIAFGSGYFFNAANLMEDEEPFAVAPPGPSDQASYYREAIAGVAVPQMFQQAGLPVPQQVALFFEDHAGFSLALQRAAVLLEDREWTRCLVGGVDSYCDPDLLEVLSDLGLLATASNPVGFAPGEGAAFLLIERSDAGPTAPSITWPAFRADGQHHFSPDRASCFRLAQAVEEALEGRDGVPFPLSIGTHNGSQFSAKEWGRTLAALPRWASGSTHCFPAASLGDTGAAAAAIGACIAVRALARGYAQGNAVLVWASSPSGSKAVFVVNQAGKRTTTGADHG